MIVPFVIGGLLAVLGLAFVLMPILAPTRDTSRRVSGRSSGGSEKANAGSGARDDGVTAIDVLREVEFDRATGKLSDSDYTELKATYTERALAEMRDKDRAGGAGLIGTSVTHCTDCQCRIAPDARYCFNCGRYLAGACPACGSAVQRVAAQFCSACGEDLRHVVSATPAPVSAAAAD